MTSYLVYFLDRADYVFAVEELDGWDDAEAVRQSRARDVPRFSNGFELWRGDRLIHKEIIH